jgi:peptide/nickel transport system permease protein
VWRDFKNSSTAVIGLCITAFTVLLIFPGAWIIPYSPVDYSFTHVLTPPSWLHPFGTDSFGRDVFIRVLYGARISLAISMTGVIFAVLIGTLIGMTSAYFGHLYDSILMRLMDLLFAFPSFVLALFLMIVLGFGGHNVALSIGLVYMPIFARLAYNLTLLVKKEPYIQAAILMGQKPLRLLVREIFPNISAPLMVQASIGVAFGIIIESGLSFLGLGVQPPTPSLGVIMADGQEYFMRAPWVLTLSGLAICFTLLGLNLLGDGLRDMVDPRLRMRKI